MTNNITGHSLSIVKKLFYFGGAYATLVNDFGDLKFRTSEYEGITINFFRQEPRVGRGYTEAMLANGWRVFIQDKRLVVEGDLKAFDRDMVHLRLTRFSDI